MNKRLLGFSLVELMVAMVVALVTVYAIYQVFGSYEGQKRTTVGVGNAETNGKNSLYLLERDIRQAGFGLSSSTTASCTTFWTESSQFNQVFSTVPVTIVANSASTSSQELPVTLYVRYGDSIRGAASASVTTPMPTPSSEINVDSTNDLYAGDVVLGVSNGQCMLMQLTQVQASALKLQHQTGTGGAYNPKKTGSNYGYYCSGNCSGVSLAGLGAGAQIVDLGNAYVTAYSIASGQDPVLEESIYSGPSTNSTGPNLSPTPAPLIDNIINVQAQYGIAASGGGQSVECWTDATDNSNNNTASPCNQNWSSANLTPALAKQIKAIRIAVVARSPVPEKQPCTETTVMPYLPWSTSEQFDLSDSGAIANWQCYRYKVFSTVIPLRNVIWADM
ncbi:MAG: PilW family protein [Betaproteobacteria bacterium]|nr:PilW family protein [Betaproteobacteria bacterium]